MSICSSNLRRPIIVLTARGEEIDEVIALEIGADDFMTKPVRPRALLRPIVRQFRTVEKTALAIAGGDLSARIKHGQSKRVLPIETAFNTMADRVESLLRSQKELLQAVSHELRTPLARIKFATELVRSADDEANRLQRVEAIDDATDKLDELVGELLDYSRSEAELEIAAPEFVYAVELINEAIRLHAPLHSEIRFKLCDPAINPGLLIHRAGILRAVCNLASNAAKYAASEVQFSVDLSTHACTINIEDDGIGIPESERQAIFEPFKRLDAGSKPGTGLGLALVRRICERLGGNVTVTKSALGGAKFCISVPLRGQQL